MRRKPSNLTISTLHDSPDIAAMVGHYVASFSYLEMTLWFYYASILGTDLQTAIGLFGEISSMKVRLDAFERHARRVKASAPDLNKHLAVFEEAKRANSFRNLLIHGLYGVSDITNELEVQSNGISPTRPSERAEPLTVEFLTAKIIDVTKLTNSIWVDFLDESFPPKVPQEALPDPA
jgi:hypothetical protein